MPLWQLDPAFFNEEIEELIFLGYIKIIGAFSLLDPPLINCQWHSAPHNLCCSYFLFIIIFTSLICPFKELIVNFSYIIMLDMLDCSSMTVGVTAGQGRRIPSRIASPEWLATFLLQPYQPINHLVCSERSTCFLSL
jgi:hypothetical protein